MGKRRFRWGCIAASLLVATYGIVGASAHAPDTSNLVTLHFNSGSLPKTLTVEDGNHATPLSLSPWEGWASADQGSMSWPDVSPDKTFDAIGWTDHAHRGGLGFVNSRTQQVRVRMTIRLPVGLWRVEAALVPGAIEPGGGYAKTLPTDTPPSLWRMEGILRSSESDTIKTLDVPPGNALYLRWTETGAAALDARRTVRRALWTTADSALQDRVSGALAPVDDILDALPTLVERGDRARITRRIHTALLATAKAQALWENGRGLAIDEPDAPFADLVTALSEIACANFDLVPSQTLVPANGSNPAHLNVTLTNAGTRTVPLVALGVEHTSGGHQSSDLSVSRALAPGGTVTKSFPIAGDPTDVRGIVQFISDYGAATVAAAPVPPASSADTSP